MCKAIICWLTLIHLLVPHVQAQGNEAPTEIILGHARSTPQERISNRRQSRDSTRATASAFLKPLAALPQTPRLGNIKRPRKNKLDQDRDGFVSKSELELSNQSRSAAFREADRNNDGKLDATEMRYFQAMIQPSGRRRR
jgi:EF hand